MLPYFFDLETVVHPGAFELRENIRVDSRLTDPEKIKKDIDTKLAKGALDPWLARPVALAFAEGNDLVSVLTFRTDNELRDGLIGFWDSLEYAGGPENKATPCGFNIVSYDMPVLLATSWRLGIHVPEHFLDVNRLKYNVCDLFLTATFGMGLRESTVYYSRSMGALCELLGIAVESDDIKGKDIAEAHGKGQWDEIAIHASRDVERTRELAKRLGVWR